MSHRRLGQTAQVYLVEGTSGSYSSASTWIVNAWLSQESAEMEVDRLNELSRKIEQEKSAIGDCPDIPCAFDSKEYLEWWQKQHALEDKYQELSGDSNMVMSPFYSTDYRVVVTTLKDAP